MWFHKNQPYGFIFGIRNLEKINYTWCSAHLLGQYRLVSLSQMHIFIILYSFFVVISWNTAFIYDI